MEHLLNNQVKQIEISGIRKFFNLVQGNDDVVSLTIGQPDLHTPESVKEAAKQAIDLNYTTYTPNAGILELREAIQNFIQLKYNLTYNAEDEIIVTVGASQAIDIALRTILSPGDEVILPGPIYPGYEPLIKLAGGIPVHIDTREHGFKMTAQLIEEHITDQTKCVILPYPSNPTGVTLSYKELEDISRLMAKKQIFILADEIYSELTYDQQHVSIGEFENVRHQTLVIQGLSKSHSMTGFRLGYLLLPKSIQKHALKVHQYSVSCASSISQYAALQALTVSKDDPIIMKNEYLKRRDYVLNRLEKMGIEVEVPNGAFYLFPKIPNKNDETSLNYCLRLVKEAQLALVPGSAFSAYGEGYMRLSYAYHQDILKLGLDRLETFINNEK
ncbi:aminotransferase A [Bacillaceae bacterium W0354]